MNLFEAFKALDALNEDTFSVSDDGIEKLDQFQQEDEETDAIDVIDTDAETEEDLQDSYVGKVILDCGVCHSKIYKDKEEVELNDDQTLANVGEECPFCYTSDGFKVIGEVADYSAEEPKDDVSTGTEDGNSDDTIKESLTENLSIPAPYNQYFDVSDYNGEDGGYAVGDTLDGTNLTLVAYLDPKKEYEDMIDADVLLLSDGTVGTYSQGRVYNVNLPESLSVSPTNDDIRDDKLESPTNTLAEAVATLERPMSAMGGTLSNVMTAHKDELATVFDRDSAISFLDSIEPEVKNKGYLGTIKEKISRLPNNRISQFLYNIILKGDGMGTKMESINESTSTYTDVDGLMGDKGAKYTEANLKAYWDREKDNDPVLANYKGDYQKWFNDTTSSMQLDEGIFGNKYKGKDILVFTGNGSEEPIAIADSTTRNHHLIHFKDAHMQKNKASKSDYKIVAATDLAVKKYKKQLKSVEDVTNDVPHWVNQYVKADKEKRFQDYKNAERQKEKDAEARRGAERDRYRNKGHNPDDDYTYIKGNGTGTYKYREDLDSTELQESVNNINVETDDSIVNVSSDDNGKVTVITEPIANEGAELTAEDVPAEGAPEGEVLAPIDAETEAEITGESGDEVDVPVDEFDEESFDELGESYLKEVYENVESFKTSSITETKDSKLVVEGIVKFDSGNQKKTSFVFEAKDCTKSGRCRFLGENLNITKGNKAFLMTGKVNNGKFISESLKYDYNDGDNKVSGFVKRG